jgi:AcrR family transcriptional regulator
MEKIAKETGCNHSLIYHHFDDKTSLWRAVKNKLVQQSQEKKALMP